jgi:hypothetical protein
MKIAEATQPPEKKSKFKRWLKNSLIVAGAAGTGTAATMVADKALGPHMGKMWNKMSPTMKRAVVGPLIGLTGIGAVLASQKLMQQRYKDENG